MQPAGDTEQTHPTTTPAPRRRTFLCHLAGIAAGAGIIHAGTRRTASANADAELIAIADEIMVNDQQFRQLAAHADSLSTRESRLFCEEHVRPLVNRSWDLRGQLAELSATTLEGFRAKARVVQAFTNCAPGFAEPWDDDALAWSLANDLVGTPSVWREEDDAEATS